MLFDTNTVGRNSTEPKDGKPLIQDTTARLKQCDWFPQNVDGFLTLVEHTARIVKVLACTVSFSQHDCAATKPFKSIIGSLFIEYKLPGCDSEAAQLLFARKRHYPVSVHASLNKIQLRSQRSPTLY